MISKLKFIYGLKMLVCYVTGLFDMLEGRIVDISYISKYALYTIRGSKFYTCEKSKTGDHTGVSYSSASVSPLSVKSSSSSLTSHSLYCIIRDLPLDKTSVHDLHLKFSSPQIYVIMSLLISNQTLGHAYTITPRSRDIRLRFWEINSLRINVTIHKTDTVTVVIGCSSNPIALDVNGIIRLKNALSIVEDRLSRTVKGFNSDKDVLSNEDIKSLGDRHKQTCTIPSHSQWIVTLWHFNADSSIEYAGEHFSITVETLQKILIRAYTKNMNGGEIRVRFERQECPNTTLADLIEQRINHNHWAGVRSMSQNTTAYDEKSKEIPNDVKQVTVKQINHERRPLPESSTEYLPFMRYTEIG